MQQDIEDVLAARGYRGKIQFNPKLKEQVPAPRGRSTCDTQPRIKAAGDLGSACLEAARAERPGALRVDAAATWQRAGDLGWGVWGWGRRACWTCRRSRSRRWTPLERCAATARGHAARAGDVTSARSRRSVTRRPRP